MPQSSVQTPPETAAARSFERRAGERHQISATVQVLEMRNGVRMTARTNDLSRGGCFLDALMPLAVGSRVRMLLSRQNSGFETLGTVTYSQAGLGMGVAFNNTQPEHQRVLDAWLDAADNRSAPADNGNASSAAPGENQASLSAVIEKLVRLLVSRGILTAEDGATFFRNLPR
jgi:PilZ domain